jgi:hypothetical protein
MVLRRNVPCAVLGAVFFTQCHAPLLKTST